MVPIGYKCSLEIKKGLKKGERKAELLDVGKRNYKNS